jgi:ribosomal protein S27E
MDDNKEVITMTIVEQAAYLKGLVAGLGIEADSQDGKLWGALTTLLSDMAHEIEDLQSDNLDMADAMDEICDELGYLEELTLDLDRPEDFEDDYEEDFDEEDYGGDADYRPDLHLYEDEELPEDEEELPEEDADEELSYDGVLYDVTCPSCGKEISFDEKTLDEGSITCPGCGEVLEFDLGDDDDE